jgi:hypothetical protein
MKTKDPLKIIMWRLLKIRKTMTYDDLQELAGVSRSYAQEWMATLIKRGVVKKIGNGKYRLIDSPRPEPEPENRRLTRLKIKGKPRGIEHPRDLATAPETRLWNAIREMKQFMVSDLVDMKLANKTTTYQYCGILVRAGYLHSDKIEGQWNKKYYTLARVTGDIPPVIGRALYLYDPNTDQIWDDIPQPGEIRKQLNENGLEDDATS